MIDKNGVYWNNCEMCKSDKVIGTLHGLLCKDCGFEYDYP